MNDSYDNPFDTLSYDEKLLSDKLGMGYSHMDYRPEPALSMSNRVRQQMREKEIMRAEIRREMQREMDKAPPVRETFVGGLSQARTDTAAKDHGYPHGSEIIEGMASGCSCGQGSAHDQPLVDNKVLIILVFVLAAFCVVQWLNQQAMATQMNEVLGAMCSLVTGKEDSGKSPPVVAVTTPTAPVATSE